MQDSRDPRKMKGLYTEFCNIIKQNMRTTHNGEEIFLHDVLMDMNFVGHEGEYGGQPQI